MHVPRPYENAERRTGGTGTAPMQVGCAPPPRPQDGNREQGTGTAPKRRAGRFSRSARLHTLAYTFRTGLSTT
eukprot:4574890-Prymnesium_polylepis.1